MNIKLKTNIFKTFLILFFVLIGQFFLFNEVDALTCVSSNGCDGGTLSCAPVSNIPGCNAPLYCSGGSFYCGNQSCPDEDCVAPTTPPPPPSVVPTCNDSNASNYRQELPCIYKYSCSGTQCVVNTSGSYTSDPTCGGACTTATPPPPPPGGGGGGSGCACYSAGVCITNASQCAPVTESCGDGRVGAGEQCDRGASNGTCPSDCSPSCLNNFCGSCELPTNPYYSGTAADRIKYARRVEKVNDAYTCWYAEHPVDDRCENGLWFRASGNNSNTPNNAGVCSRDNSRYGEYLGVADDYPYDDVLCAQRYSCYIFNNLPPLAPTVTGPATGYNNINLFYSASTTDPDSNDLKYGIDWDNDDVVDQWVPFSSFVFSGVSIQTYRSWPTVGVKTFKVKAQDDKGLSSGWTSKSVTISLQNPPTAPTITCTNCPSPNNGYQSTNYNFNITATDPEGNQIRYGVDWLNGSGVPYGSGDTMDGIADVWVPASGYVNSGTAQSTTLNWPTTGAKKFQALAQDSNGANSSWTTYNINIGNALADLVSSGVIQTTAGTNVLQSYTATITNSGAGSTGASFPYFFQTCNVGGGCVSPTNWPSSTMAALGAGSSGTATSPSTPSIKFTTAGTYSIRVCADKTNNLGGGVIDEGTNEGNNCGDPWTDVVVSDVPVPVVTLTVKCASGGTPASSCSGTTGSVNPAITWSTTNSPTSCTFAGSWTNTNGDSFNGTNIAQGVISTAGTYVYQLSCTNVGGTGSVTSVTVTVTDPAPTFFNLKVNGNVKPVGGSIKTTESNPINCGTTCNKDYLSGARVDLKVYPDSSYWKFVNWLGDCLSAGTASTCTLNIDGDKNVNALFAPRGFDYKEF